jgi:integrating conjugative element protein (TIGR03758 family)
MAAPAPVMTAFQAGSGISGASAYMALAVILAALLLIWLAWTVSGLGQRLLDGRLEKTPVLWYTVRALLLVFLIVFVLVQ